MISSTHDAARLLALTDEFAEFKRRLIADPRNTPLRQVFARRLREEGLVEEAEFQEWYAGEWDAGRRPNSAQ